MSDAKTLQPTLIENIWPSYAGSSGLLRGVLLAVLGAAALTVSAKISVPFYPVPMTMQTYVVLMIGMAYGLRLGAATVALYLAQGAVGLPVFATGGGIAYFAGPTGGYLVGFLVAAAAMGALADRGWSRSLVKVLAALALGTVIPFLLGVSWLAVFLGDFGKAVAGGLLPFIWGSVFKFALAAATLPFAWKLVERVKSKS
jgi:biotin transport system substrate-specific component